ncbi:nucleotide kinase domain-containing protein, partial [Lacticaseibacillus paracasei]
PVSKVKELFTFIQERHDIYKRKQAGLPKPWTSDSILQKYRFCNVYRELDTQTKWLSENWGHIYRNDPDYWFACVVYRLT